MESCDQKHEISHHGRENNVEKSKQQLVNELNQRASK